MSAQPTITTRDDLLSVLAAGDRYESESKFMQGDALFQAAEPDRLRALGFGTQEQLIKWVAVELGRARRTMWKRLQVSRTFAPIERNDRVSWEAHYICSTTDDPHYWLARCADMEMSTDQLKAAIKAAGGDPERGERVYLLRAADAVIADISEDGMSIMLRLDRPVEAESGQLVIVTMAWEPVEVQTAAQEATA